MKKEKATVMTTFNLLANTMNDNHNYTITIEETHLGLVRFCITVESEDQHPGGFNNHQGIDLTAIECEAIGRHLLAISKRMHRQITQG